MSTEYPFLFINHGEIDQDALDKSSEVVLWFRDPVAAGVRDSLFVDCPAPLASVIAWDASFCYFGSPGDSYDSLVVTTYVPAELRAILDGNPSDDVQRWMNAFRAAQESAPASLAAFSKDLDRWLARVHSVAPIAMFWGPHGASERDPWHVWSLAHFDAEMSPRLEAYTPGRQAREPFAWIRKRARTLQIAPPARNASRDDTKTVALLDGAARETRPRGFVSRLTQTEHEIQETASQIATFVGKGAKAPARLAQLAPLTQLTLLASYAVDRAAMKKAGCDIVAEAVSLSARLREDERRAGVWLLTMMAQTLVNDTPAFDAPRRSAGRDAARVLRPALGMPGVRAATYARLSRYLRWARSFDEAGEVATAGLARFGDRRVLLRAAMKAAKRAGDDVAAAKFAARFDALPPAAERDD